MIKSILAISGKEIFCDSSKRVNRLKKMLNCKLFDVHILHLIRDGRAVGYSHKKKRERIRLGKGNRGEFYKIIKHWNETNVNSFDNFKNNEKYQYIRYEDLTNNPPKYVSQIGTKSNFEYESNQVRFWEVCHHNISGNQMRMNSHQEIKMNKSYLDSLSLKEWWIGSMYARAGLKLFGYPLFREKFRSVW